MKALHPAHPTIGAESCAEARGCAQPLGSPGTRSLARQQRVHSRTERELGRDDGNWMEQAYRAARHATFSQSVARLQQAAPAAVTTLLKTLVDPAAPASVRVRAAECIMNHAIKAIELEDIEGRLAELERTAEESSSGGRR